MTFYGLRTFFSSAAKKRSSDFISGNWGVLGLLGVPSCKYQSNPILAKWKRQSELLTIKWDIVDFYAADSLNKGNDVVYYENTDKATLLANLH